MKIEFICTNFLFLSIPVSSILTLFLFPPWSHYNEWWRLAEEQETHLNSTGELVDGSRLIGLEPWFQIGFHFPTKGEGVTLSTITLAEHVSDWTRDLSSQLLSWPRIETDLSVKRRRNHQYHELGDRRWCAPDDQMCGIITNVYDSIDKTWGKIS